MREDAFTPEDRVLILGATGFIGRRLVRALADGNIKMRLLVRDPASAKETVPRGKTSRPP